MFLIYGFLDILWHCFCVCDRFSLWIRLNLHWWMHEIRVNIQSQFQDLFSATGSLYTLRPIAQNICRVVAWNQAHGHGISLPTRFHKYRSGGVCVLPAVVHGLLEATHQVFSRATAVPSRCTWLFVSAEFSSGRGLASDFFPRVSGSSNQRSNVWPTPSIKRICFERLQQIVSMRQIKHLT